ncbi:tRNA (adenosine(37)-N6)-threonylcarbamoyltransferase complex transferase subunit TsaD [Prochlorococcus sp. MIT 1307]|uniref:tRNA (adenosine(37)-N6)-threonylcarbamoyltransferase complex transferase subunit TsaD n=1 Tax=Prochlorococcus sp. MIT 1307 TaxID=3096219 RepID=UPI002A7662C1|nr:tRNA (adenosine(37)-N6)-threonylcarbamoyltransferase complex transferase subunit TsaD [Prochlorococcus sp. MIT 1307]
MRYNPKSKTVLALETSCDETAVALLKSECGQFRTVANLVASQIEEHAKWGGVVPEIASRRHLEALPFLVEEVLSTSGQSMREIDAVAATVTPGLNGALLIGSVTARTLSALHQKPFLGIHHLEGHLASVFLNENPPRPPYLVLLVSGGHTELIKVNNDCKYQRLGRSHDDAAGEAFDKVARLLGLGYPGGPAIEKLATYGNPKAYSLPKGRVSNPAGGFYPYDFSFSGLKTAMLRQVQLLETKQGELPLENLAASFENIVAEVLVERSIRCVLNQELKTLVMVGGVAANKRLRKMMSDATSSYGVALHMAPKAFCTDNAAMIGVAALKRLESGVSQSSIQLGVSPRWSLEQADLLYRANAPF